MWPWVNSAGGTDVGDGDGFAQGEKLLYSDGTGHRCKYTAFPTFVIIQDDSLSCLSSEVDRASSAPGGADGVWRTAGIRWALRSSYEVEDLLFADHGYGDGNFWSRQYGCYEEHGAALLQSTFTLTNEVLTLHDYGGENMQIWRVRIMFGSWTIR